MRSVSAGHTEAAAGTYSENRPGKCVGWGGGEDAVLNGVGIGQSLVGQVRQADVVDAPIRAVPVGPGDCEGDEEAPAGRRGQTLRY